MIFQLKSTKGFDKQVKKLLSTGRLTEQKIESVLGILVKDPFDKRLITHKVGTKNLGKRYSSRVDGDLRLIWDFDESDRLILLLLDIGGHSGAKKVYSK